MLDDGFWIIDDGFLMPDTQCRMIVENRPANGGFCSEPSVAGSSINNRVSSIKNVIIADYTNLEIHSHADIEDLLQIDRSVRDRIEVTQSEKVAMQICSRLPKNEAEVESMIQTGYELAKNMSWDVVVKNYLLSSLQSICTKKPALSATEGPNNAKVSDEKFY